MQLRVIKERWNEDGSPMLDLSKPHQPQLVNGGMVRVLDPKTHLPRTYLPGEVLDLPDVLAQDILVNSPQSVEPEEQHQARLVQRRRRDADREAERDALDARMRELSRETEQAQKQRAMIEERERTLAAENLRISQVASGKDSLLAELKQQMAEMHASYAAKLAELEARLAAAPAADKPAGPPSEPAPESRSRRKVSG